MSSPNNPAAFPSIERLEHSHREWGGRPVFYKATGSGGMTLRDWFAAQALQSLMARGAKLAPSKIMAGAAYQIADAMLAARGDA